MTTNAIKRVFYYDGGILGRDVKYDDSVPYPSGTYYVGRGLRGAITMTAVKGHSGYVKVAYDDLPPWLKTRLLLEA